MWAAQARGQRERADAISAAWLEVGGRGATNEVFAQSARAIVGLYFTDPSIDIDQHASQAASRALDVGSPSLHAWARICRAQTLIPTDEARALQELDAALAGISHVSDEHWARGPVDLYGAIIAFQLDDMTLAHARLERLLRWAIEKRFGIAMLMAIYFVALLEHRRGSNEQAGLLLGAAEQHTYRGPATMGVIEMARTTIPATLGNRATDILAEGARLDLLAAARQALRALLEQSDRSP